MTATAVKIADALVAELNGHEFSQPFVAVRLYLPSYKLEDMDSLHVTVAMAGFEGVPADRSRDKEDHTLHVAIQQRFAAPTGEVPIASLDSLMLLAEEIRDFLRTLVLVDIPEAKRVGTECKPIYDPNHLREFNQFTSLLLFTYRITR